MIMSRQPSSSELHPKTHKSQVMSKVKTDKISVPQSIPAIHKSRLKSPKSRREIPTFGPETDKSQVKTGKSLIKADKSQVKNNKFKVKNHTFQIKFDQSNVGREKSQAKTA